MSDLENVTTFDQALNRYAEAIRTTEFWREYGHYGDGKFESALVDEQAARRLVKRKRMGP